MTEKCFICNIELNIDNIYLCKNHTQDLINNFNDSKETKVINNPSEKEHCYICGEWADRDIIKFLDWAYICSVCIKEAKDAYGL